MHEMVVHPLVHLVIHIGGLPGLPLIGDRVTKEVDKELANRDPIQVVIAREGVPQVPLTIIEEIRPIRRFPLDGVCRNPQGVETLLHLCNKVVGEIWLLDANAMDDEDPKCCCHANLPNKQASGVSCLGYVCSCVSVTVICRAATRFAYSTALTRSIPCTRCVSAAGAWLRSMTS